VKNQRTHHDMGFKHSQSVSSQFSYDGSKTHPSDTATKHAHKIFLSRHRGFFSHFFLWVKGWLWIGWVVGFGWFECFLFFVVVEARNKLRSTYLTLFSHLSNSTPNLYVDLVTLSSTRLKFSSIIFSLKTVFSRHAVK
jgi:hypothetical protein